MLSFVIPIVGAIAAVLLLVKPNEEDRETGKACLRWVLYGLVVDAVIYFGVLFKFTDFFHFI